jgi:hypothetical protein
MGAHAALSVMARLVPAIHDFLPGRGRKLVDAWAKPGHDGSVPLG